MNELESLILPKKHNIRSVNLDGPFKLDTQDVDAIIENIYRNTVSKNLTGGYFTLSADWTQYEDDKSMTGPHQLLQLKN